jgi:hypothetical protein
VHPVRLVVTDDLERSRLTVLFRLLLVLPHLLWIALWGTIAFVIAVINWFATLFKGRSPEGLHDFLAGYTRYVIQVWSYFLLAANPYPGFFLGTAKPYPVDLEIDRPERQRRLVTGFRLLLALPAFLLAGVLAGSVIHPAAVVVFGAGLAPSAAFLAWFAVLVRGRSPRGLRDITVWGLGYVGQLYAYVFLLTDRYPFSDPRSFVRELDSPSVDSRVPRLHNADDLRRSRLTVFFRLALAAPHIVWILGWSVLAVLAAIANWLAALVTGRSPRLLARFLSAYVRYSAHLTAFLFLVGNPFCGFVGRQESYPVDVRVEPFERQSRWITLLRIPLAIPAYIVSSAGSSVLFVAGFLGWFAAVLRGRMPAGLQAAGAWAIGYNAQWQAYVFVLTDRYPHSSPQAVFSETEPAEERLD